MALLWLPIVRFRRPHALALRVMREANAVTAARPTRARSPLDHCRGQGRHGAAIVGIVRSRHDHDGSGRAAGASPRRARRRGGRIQPRGQHALKLLILQLIFLIKITGLESGNIPDSGPMLSKREQNRLEQQARILGAAFLLFAAHGFDEVTMTQVAERAGVSRATVFTYYPSKPALVDAMTGKVMAYWQAMLDRALEEVEVPIPLLLRALLDHVATRIEQFEVFNQSMFREITKFQAGIDEGTVAQEGRRASAERLTKLFSRGQERAELSRNYRVADLVAAFDSMFNGAIIRWLYDDRSESLRDRMHRTTEIFLGSVGELEMSEGALPDLTPHDIQPPDDVDMNVFLKGEGHEE